MMSPPMGGQCNSRTSTPGYAGSCEVETVSAETWWKRNPDEVLDMMVNRFREIC